jgi:hypothetical protein
MKGMSQTLYIVVAAIVVLVAALVVITILAGGVQQVASITQAQALCQTSAAASCSTANAMPPTWNSDTVRIGDGAPTSCSEVEGLGGCTCDNYQLANC